MIANVTTSSRSTANRERTHNIFLAANGHTEDDFEHAMFIARTAYVHNFLENRKEMNGTD